MRVTVKINNVNINVSDTDTAERISEVFTNYARHKCYCRRRIDKLIRSYERRRNDSEEAMTNLSNKIIMGVLAGEDVSALRIKYKVWEIRNLVAQRMLAELEG